MKGVFQRVGQQHAQIAVGDQEKGWERHRRVQGNAVPAGALRKGGEDEICRIVFTVPLYLLCLDLRADTGDIGLCPLCLPLFDTARQILQVVTQVMAVGAGLLLGLAQGIDLPDRLGHLHPQTVLKLLEPVPLLLLSHIIQKKRQIGSAADKGHKLHHHRTAAGQEIRVDDGCVVKHIVHRWDHAEYQLQFDGVIRQSPDGRRGKPQQQDKQRQRDNKLHHILHHMVAGGQRHHKQRKPAPELAAEVGGQDGNR